MTTMLDETEGIALADCNTNTEARVVGDSVVFRRLPEGRLVSYIARGRSVVSTGVYSEGRYRWADPETGRVAYFGEYPQGEYRIGQSIVATAYINSRLAMKPDRSQFVCVNSNCGVVEINAFAGDSIVRTALVAYHYPDVAETRVGKMPVAAIRQSNINGFFDVTCSDSLIYTIYSGKSFDNAGLGFSDCGYVVVFDWSGHPVGCYRVEPELCAIHCDRSSGTLYGLAHTADSSGIYRLELNR